MLVTEHFAITAYSSSSMVKALITVVVLLLALLALFVWPTRFRYETLKLGDNSFRIRVDRLSDKTWRLTRSGWVPQWTEVVKGQVLPSIAGINGRCRLQDQALYCDIGNDTEYTLYTVTVELTGEPNNLLASCKAELKGWVEPHTMGTMGVKPSCAYELKPDKWSWNIVAATGKR